MMILADVLKWAETYTGPKFHALLSDPPYHMTEVTKRFGKADAAPAQYGKDGAFSRASRGFMGKTWDGGDLAFRPETWAAICQHLLPGAWGMVYASSRGWHRLAVAIEDAGMIIQPTIWRWTSKSGQIYVGSYEEIQALMIRDQIGTLEQLEAPPMLGWAYGSGFPKATRVDSQIDAAAFRAWLKYHPRKKAVLAAVRRAERAARKEKRTADASALKSRLKRFEAKLRERAGLAPRVIGQKKHQPKFAAAELGYREKDNGYNSRERKTFDVTAPATEDAERWVGYRYGGQALKPSLEPIIVFQKPFEGSALKCLTTTGAGALWIDGGKIGTSKNIPASPRGPQDRIYGAYGAQDGTEIGHDPNTGRWPANFMTEHHPACDGVCHPACPVRHLGEQSGESASKASQRGQVNIGQFGGGSGQAGKSTERGHDDSGTAARYFYQSDWMYERLEASDPALYYPKASRAEREAGLDPHQTAIMREIDDSDEEETWESQDHDQAIQAEWDGSPVRDTTESTGMASPHLHMLCDGCRNTGRSPRGTKSTTKTTTNKTTRSKTLSLSTRSPINDSTVAVNSDPASGGNLAVCAVCSSPLPQSTGISAERDGHSMASAEDATYDRLSNTNRIAEFPESVVSDGRQTPIDNPYQRGETERRNIHPTIKPIALSRYLATLLLPPAEYAPRRLLIPFAGAGSEVIGAMLAGWEQIEGIELMAEHVQIAAARIAYWQQRRWELGDPARAITVKAPKKAPAGQLDMFAEQPEKVPTFDEWYHGHDGKPGTEDYGGSREEYDRLYRKKKAA